MTLFLDTNILIFAMKGMFPRIMERLAASDPERIKVPAIVLAELVCGALKSVKPGDAMKVMERFLAPYEIVPFCKRSAMHHGQIRAHLELQGEKIGPNDMIIAATVLAHGGTLVTHNLREFRRVSDLKVEDWTE